MSRPFAAVLPLLLFSLAGTWLVGDPPSRLALVQTIELPGVRGRIDHVDIDIDGHRLFVGALENDSLEVIDLAAGRVQRSLGSLGGPQGLAFVPAVHALFVACRDTGELIELEDSGFRVVRRFPFGDEADNLHYLRLPGLLVLGYGSGGLAVIDPVVGKVVSNTRLPGHPEGLQGEEEGTRVFVNVPTANRLFELSRLDAAVLRSWPMSGLYSSFPLALDEERHRIAYYSHVPSEITLFDTEAGKAISRKAAPADVDDLYFGPRPDELILIAGAGRVELWRIGAAGAMERVDTAATGPGARTGLFVPALARLFVAVPAREGRDARILVFDLGGRDGR